MINLSFRRSAAGPSRSRRPLAENRRGAVLVWAALMVLALVGFGAFAVDFGSFYITAAEVQNSADAAALAGGRALQLTTATTAAGIEATVDANAVNLAGQNSVNGRFLVITNDSVSLRHYTPPGPTCANALGCLANAPPSGGSFNAVEVRTGQQRDFLFGQVLRNMFGATGVPTMNRRAVAWIANVNSGECVKPWALPYTALYDRVVQITGITSPRTPPGPNQRPDLSQQQLAELSNSSLSDARRIIIFRPPTYDGAGGNPDSSAAIGSATSNIRFNNGMYAAYNFTSPSGNNNAGGTSYQANIIGCTAQTVSINTDNGATLPGSNDIPCLTANAILGSTANNCNGSWPDGLRINSAVTCHMNAPGTTDVDARCFGTEENRTLGVPGRLETVAWGDGVFNGSNQTDFRMIGRIQLLCMFRGLSTPTRSETCYTGDPSIQPQGFPRGTLVGVIQRESGAVLSPRTELGNVVSDQQKLMLVR